MITFFEAASQFIFHEHYCPSPTKTMMYCQKSVVALLQSPNTTLVRLSQDQKGYIFFLLAERCEQKIFWGLWFQFSCICSKVLLLLGPSGKIIIPYMITYRINQLFTKWAWSYSLRRKFTLPVLDQHNIDVACVVFQILKFEFRRLRETFLFLLWVLFSYSIFLM